MAASLLFKNYHPASLDLTRYKRTRLHLLHVGQGRNDTQGVRYIFQQAVEGEVPRAAVHPKVRIAVLCGLPLGIGTKQNCPAGAIADKDWGEECLRFGKCVDFEGIKCTQGQGHKGNKVK